MVDITMEGADKARSLWLSLIAILSVVLVESLAGLLVNSLSILGDAVHASFDVMTTFLLLMMTRWSLQPPDDTHTYGHEKIESIGGMIGGVLLIVLTALLGWEAVVRIMEGGIPIHPGTVGFAAVLYTLGVDFFRVGVLRKTQGSATVKAGLLHALSDMSSTIVALIGISLASFGYYLGDALSSLVLCIVILYVGVGLIRDTFIDLSDAIPKTIVKRVEEGVSSTRGITGTRALKMRKVGRRTFVDVVIKVPSYLGLEDAHTIASAVESNVGRTIGDSVVMVHVEPELTATPIDFKIKKLSAGVPGVKDVHNVEVIRTSAGLNISLHAAVSPAATVEEAHRHAEEIEKKLRAEIPSLVDAKIHLEPFEGEAMVGRVVDSEEISEAVAKTINAHREVKELGEIRLYKVGDNLHIDISCSFGKEASVNLAHEIATEIEEKLKGRFQGAKVTIHQEPA